MEPPGCAESPPRRVPRLPESPARRVPGQESPRHTEVPMWHSHCIHAPDSHIRIALCLCIYEFKHMHLRITHYARRDMNGLTVVHQNAGSSASGLGFSSCFPDGSGIRDLGTRSYSPVFRHDLLPVARAAAAAA